MVSADTDGRVAVMRNPESMWFTVLLTLDVA